MKRFFDLLVAITGLLVLFPALILVASLVWLQDFQSPLYMARRVRKGGSTFKMIKLRSMVKNADKLGGTSTSETDNRITLIGRFIRKAKLDEITQLWNVLIGQMSLVGPRPQTPFDTGLYTEEEKTLLTIRPGITDLASIVFADEANILSGSNDPDLLYNQIIRPWKSRLSIFYVKNNSINLDILIIFLTLIGMFSRKRALRGVQKILSNLHADQELVKIAGRKINLYPFPPPGASSIIDSIPSNH